MERMSLKAFKEALKKEDFNDLRKSVNINDMMAESFGSDGELLGRLFLAGKCYEYENRYRRDVEPPFDWDLFNTCERNIINPYEKDIMAGFRCVYLRLLSIHNKAKGDVNKALYNLKNMELDVDTLTTLLEAKRFVNKLPYFMSKKEYKKFNKSVSNMLAGRKVAPLTLFRLAFRYNLQLLAMHPRRKNPLKDVKRFLINAPILDPEFITDFPNKYGWGDFTFSDGKKVSDLSYSRLEKRLSKETSDNTMYFITSAIYLSKENKGFVGPFFSKFGLANYPNSPVTWTPHAGDIPVNVLSQWALLADNGDIRNNEYPALDYFSTGPIGQSDIDSIKKVAKYYPAFFNAILDDIAKKIPEIKDITLDDWGKSSIDASKPFKVNLYNFSNACMFSELNKKTKRYGGLSIFIGDEFAADDSLGYVEPDLVREITRTTQQRELAGLLNGGKFSKRAPFANNLDSSIAQLLINSVGYSNRAITIVGRALSAKSVSVFLTDVGQSSEVIELAKGINGKIMVLLDCLRRSDVDKDSINNISNIFARLILNPLVDIDAEKEQALMDALKDLTRLQETIFKVNDFFEIGE